LEYIKDFLEKSSVIDIKVADYFDCNDEEFRVLQYLLNSYLMSKDILLCSIVLLSVFDKDSLTDDIASGMDNFDFSKNIDILEKVEVLKSLLKKGWIVSSMGLTEVLELTNIEVLNCTFSLSRYFFIVLTNGKPDYYKLLQTEYSDEVDYLTHQFKRVEYYQALSHFRNSYDFEHPSIPILTKNIELIEEDIQNNLKKIDTDMKLNDFFVKHELSNDEQVIFILLLKNEYLQTDDSLTFYNLINLVSFSDEDRIRNRKLLSNNSKLIKDGIIYASDDYFINDMNSYFIDRDILESFDLIVEEKSSKKKKRKTKAKIEDLVEEQDIFEYIEPKTTLDDVVLNPQTLKTLENLLQQVDTKVIARLKEWGIKDKKAGISSKIIFYGTAGTGKTMTAYSLAKSLKRGILSFDCSKVLSMYIGESEKNVRKIFDDFKDISKQLPKEPILLLNEADQFLSTRTTTSGSGSEKMHNQMQNIFLEQIEKFDGILIATTNLLETIDKAFSRRFNYKIEFKKPTLAQREVLWEKLLPKNAPFENIDIKSLAKYDLTGGQIKIIIENTAFKVACKKEPLFTMKDFVEEIEKEKKGSFDTTRHMGFEL
jgi:SpoVK/Ycf46/Vps4 family AAA+-type ATPase